jgi:hypothetical protein
LDLLLSITNAISVDCKSSFRLRQAGGVIDLADTSFGSTFTQIQSKNNKRLLKYYFQVVFSLSKIADLVVEECAMIFPPIGFFGSAANIAPPST